LPVGAISKNAAAGKPDCHGSKNTAASRIFRRDSGSQMTARYLAEDWPVIETG
jgi:hypothetical protein